jgi:hypothetical protein
MRKLVCQKQPLHVGGPGDVALDGDGLTAVRFDVGDNTVRALPAGILQYLANA